MSHQNRVAGVSNVRFEGNTAIKTIRQVTKGSAYQKIPGQVIAMHNAGFNRIVLEINRDHPYMLRIEDQVSTLRNMIPNIIIEKT